MGSCLPAAILAFFSALSADKVAAEDIGAEVSVGYDTDYMFRGVNLGQDLLWSDVNVSTSLSDGLDLGVGAWYANVADDAGNDELDIYAGLSTSMGDMSVDLGATYYYYPDPTAGEGTLEFGIGLGTSAGPIDLSLGLYYDIDLEAAYYEVGAATSFEGRTPAYQPAMETRAEHTLKQNLPQWAPGP